MRSMLAGASVEGATSAFTKAVVKAGTWLKGVKPGTSTITGAFRTLGHAGRLGQLALRFIWHQVEHFMKGATFLFTLGAIGSAFGDGGLFAEVIFQGLLAASVLVSIGQQRAFKQNEFSGRLYEEAMEFVENEVGTERGFLGRKISQFRESWSIIKQFGNPGLQQARNILVVLNIASIALQVGTVMASAYGVM